MALLVDIYIIMLNFFAGEANVTIHAPSSVQQGQSAMLECRTGHELSAIKRLTWGESSITGHLYLYRYRHNKPSADLLLYLKGRGVDWWSDNSNVMYINSTRLTDSGNYTCSVKTQNDYELAKRPLVVYGECSLFFVKKCKTLYNTIIAYVLHELSKAQFSMLLTYCAPALVLYCI